ncbi:MAG: mercury(II) reductase [Alphaproteobacteria bacterium]|nr:mercury(II) reductase [Alphaproteobacteria bacterium]
MSDCCPSKESGAYDLAVIGAGSAGFSAAITATEEGAQVALIGHGTIGGTCVNVGCVPSKTMIRAAEALYGAGAASRFPGLVGEAHVANWRELIAAKENLVTSLRQKKYIDLLPEYESVTYLEGKARLTDGGVVVDGANIKAGKTIIATGSSSTVPPISGIESVAHLDSTQVLELDAAPKSLLVIGGGVIGCELGQMFARFGVKVTICCRSRLLPEMEPEISEALQAALEDEGVTVCAGISYQKIEQAGDHVKLYCENKDGAHVIEAEKLLVATGRKPNTENLGLEGIGVALLPNGGVKIDERMQSTNPDIYAAGDVTGSDMFVYMAAYGAKLAAKNALNSNSHSYDNSAMPAVVFTDPQAASVGLTEAAAMAEGYTVKTSLLGLEHVPRALAARDTRGLIKLIADDKTDRLLGAHILAPEGADSIQTAVLAIKSGMTAKALGETVFPYLTTVEGLKLAAQSFGKDVNKLSCCAG